MKMCRIAQTQLDVGGGGIMVQDWVKSLDKTGRENSLDLDSIGDDDWCFTSTFVHMVA